MQHLTAIKTWALNTHKTFHLLILNQVLWIYRYILGLALFLLLQVASGFKTHGEVASSCYSEASPKHDTSTSMLQFV